MVATPLTVQAFHDHLQRALRAAGARLDDIRYCPYLEGGTIEAYARPSDWRKPAPGMLLDLMRAWPVAAAPSLVVGDKDIDVQAAQAAGLRGLLFPGGDIDKFLAPYLAR